MTVPGQTTHVDWISGPSASALAVIWFNSFEYGVR